MGVSQKDLLEKLWQVSQRDLGPIYYSWPWNTANVFNHPFRIVIVLRGTATVQLSLSNHTQQETPVPEGGIVLALPDSTSGGINQSLACETMAISFLDHGVRITNYSVGDDESSKNFTLQGLMLREMKLPQVLQSVNDTLCRLSREREELQQRASLLVRGQLQLLHGVLTAESEKKVSKSEVTWKRVADYLADHLSQDLSRYAVARAMSLNPSHLSTLCQQHTQRTFNEYVKFLRLNQAQSLLELHGPLDEVAQQCGFNYTSYFIREFKKLFGVTPGQFRR